MKQRRRIYKTGFGIFLMICLELFLFAAPVQAEGLDNDYVARDFFYHAKEDRGWQLSEVQKSRLEGFKELTVDKEAEVQTDVDIYKWSYSWITLPQRKEKLRYQDVSCSVADVKVSEGFEVVSFTGLGTGSLNANNRIKLVARKGGLKGKLEIKYRIDMGEVWKYVLADSDDGYVKAFDTAKGHYTFNIHHTYSGTPITGYVTETYEISSKPTGTIKTKDAQYVLGESWDQEARSRLLDTAKEIDGQTIPYSNDKIVPTIPEAITNAIKEFDNTKRIDALFDDTVTLKFNSDTGESQSSSQAVAGYGNAIVLHGLEEGSGRDAGGAFALVTDDDNQPKIIATSGVSKDNQPIHSLFKDDFYCGIAYLDMTSQNERELTSISVKDYQWGPGNMEKQAFLDLWGTKRVQSVNYGDLVKVENIEGKIGYATNSTYTSIKQFDNPDDGQKEVFFEITDHGFVPLVINQLKPLEIQVPFKATQEQLNKKLQETLDKRRNDQVYVERFSQNPVTDKTGATQAKVIAVQTLESGKKVQYEYTVPVIIQEPGSIETKEGQYILGEVWNTAARAKLLAAAKEADGTTVAYSSDKIIPTIPDSISNAIKNERIDALFAADVPLTFNSVTGTVTSTSKATVNYGNALVLRGREWSKNYDAGGAFALVTEEGQLKIIATSGGKAANSAIHDLFSEEFYTGIAYLDMSQTASKDLTGISVKDFHWAKGDTKKQEFLDAWGTNRVQNVNAGDLIKVENVEGKIGYTLASTYFDVKKLKNRKEVFFEVTAKGYQPLVVNQIEPLKAEVPNKASKAELQACLPKFLSKADQKNVTVEKFSQAPVTDTNGTQPAKIVISQTLQSGKKATFEYAVQVDVKKRGELKTQGGKYVLGEKWTLNSPGRMFVSAKETDGSEVSWSDEKIESILPKNIETKLNEKNKRIDQLFTGIEIPIGFKSQTGYVQAASKADAGYGDALVLEGYEYVKRDAGGVFALIKEADQPKIVATSGYLADNEAIHSYYNGKFYQEVAFFSRKNAAVLDVSPTAQPSTKCVAQGDTKKQDFLNQWGTDRVLPVNYGDILQVNREDNKFYSTKDSVKQPLKNLVKPNEVFYEVTPEGYQALTLNQVAFDPIVVEHDTTKTLIEQKITQQLKKAQPKLQIEEIKIADLAAVGDSEISLVVSEKSHSNPKNKIVYQYKIKLTVQEGSLSFENFPQKVEFGTVEIKNQQQTVFCKSSTEKLSIGVKDTRSKKSPWHLSVKVSQPFRNEQNQVIPANILFYRQNKKDLEISEKAQPVFTAKEKQVYQKLEFSGSEGLLLKIPENLKLPVADYHCEIQWTLNDTPL